MWSNRVGGYEKIPALIQGERPPVADAAVVGPGRLRGNAFPAYGDSSDVTLRLL